VWGKTVEQIVFVLTEILFTKMCIVLSNTTFLKSVGEMTHMIPRRNTRNLKDCALKTIPTSKYPPEHVLTKCSMRFMHMRNHRSVTWMTCSQIQIITHNPLPQLHPHACFALCIRIVFINELKGEPGTKMTLSDHVFISN